MSEERKIVEEEEKKKGALIIVDVQNDFLPPDGALAVPDGDKIIPVINRYIEKFKDNPIFATADWHPENHISFKERGGPWPPHCVQNTKGAEFHKDLNLPEKTIVIRKAYDPDKEAYSGFDGTELAQKLRELGVDTVFICGVATEYCVKNTVLDALKNGFKTYLLLDAIKGINPQDEENAIEEMKRAGAIPVTIEDVPPQTIGEKIKEEFEKVAEKVRETSEEVAREISEEIKEKAEKISKDVRKIIKKSQKELKKAIKPKKKDKAKEFVLKTIKKITELTKTKGAKGKKTQKPKKIQKAPKVQKAKKVQKGGKIQKVKKVPRALARGKKTKKGGGATMAAKATKKGSAKAKQKAKSKKTAAKKTAKKKKK